MSYKLANTGDSIPVPQLVFSKLPQLEDDWLRVALYVIATGETDPAAIARELRLSGPERAREALLYWKGAGLLESADPAPSGSGDIAAAAPREHLTAPEVMHAAQADPAIWELLQECQVIWGGVIPQADANILVSMYLIDHMPVDLILLGAAHYVSLGKRSARYIERALLGWQRDGITSAEAAEQYLNLLARRKQHEQEVAGLLGLAQPAFTKAESRTIASWYEEMGYGPDMISEAISTAGDKKSVRYVGGILRKWHAKGLRTVKDVLTAGRESMQNIQPSNPSPKPVLGSRPRRAPTFQKKGGGT